MSSSSHYHISPKNLSLCEIITDKQLQKLKKKELSLIESLLSIYLKGFISSSTFTFLESTLEDHCTDNIFTFPVSHNQRISQYNNRIIHHDLTSTELVTLQEISINGFDEKNIDHRTLSNTVLDNIVFSAFKKRRILVCRPSKVDKFNLIKCKS